MTEFIEFTQMTEFIEFTQMTEFIEFSHLSEFNEFSHLSEFAWASVTARATAGHAEQVGPGHGVL